MAEKTTEWQIEPPVELTGLLGNHGPRYWSFVKAPSGEIAGSAYGVTFEECQRRAHAMLPALRGSDAQESERVSKWAERKRQDARRKARK